MDKRTVSENQKQQLEWERKQRRLLRWKIAGILVPILAGIFIARISKELGSLLILIVGSVYAVLIFWAITYVIFFMDKK
jgi:hypothetical protein